MLLLTSTSDLIQVVTGSTGDVRVHASWVDNNAGVITPGRTNTASISTATTTTVVGSPASSTQRNCKFLSVRNNHASTSNLVTIQHTDGTNVETLWAGTLLAGESINFTADTGWQYLDANGAVKPSTGKLDAWLQVVNDIAYSTAATFADVTGLTLALKSGKKYLFETHLYHISGATTTGAQFAVNIGAAPTQLVVATFSGVTNSVTAGALSIGSATARDTAVTAQTTGSANITLTIMSGMIIPSADGTFAIRATAEVAATMTVKAGSWLHVRELDN